MEAFSEDFNAGSDDDLQGMIILTNLFTIYIILLEGTRGSNSLMIANGTEEDLKVDVNEGTLLRPCNTPGRNFAFGAGPGGAHMEVTASSLIRHFFKCSLVFKVGVTSKRYNTIEADIVTNIIGPHSLWKVPVAANDTKMMKKVAKIQNSLQVVIYTKVSLTN